jgi:hypothetical protein
MNGVLLQLCDATRVSEGRVNHLFARAVLAALSADPDTFAELEVALGRYVKRDGDHRLLSFLDEPVKSSMSSAPGCSAQPTSAPSSSEDDLLWIDLAGRVVAYRGDRLDVAKFGDVKYLEADALREVTLSFRLRSSWMVCLWDEQVPTVARQRREEREARPPLDVRKVLYGRLPQTLAEEFVRRRDVLGDDPIRELHEHWLLTPRDDLNGATPREVLVDQLDSMVDEMSARCWEWSVLGVCPPPLPDGALAVTHGPIGMHEFVLYYDLVRRLLGAAMSATPDVARDTAALTSLLTQTRDVWLDQVDEQELHGRTPRQLIEDERRRIPWAMTGQEAMIDHDCPLCRMMAEQSDSPYFCHLDASGFDDRFAFSPIKTREEWEEEEAAFQEFQERPSASPALNSEESLWQAPTATLETGVWRTCRFAPGQIEHMPPSQQFGIWQFRILAQLIEVREDVDGELEDELLVEKVIEHIEDLREAVRRREGWLADACFGQATSCVEELMEHRGDLAAKCHDVRHSLQMLRQNCLVVMTDC